MKKRFFPEKHCTKNLILHENHEKLLQTETKAELLILSYLLNKLNCSL